VKVELNKKFKLSTLFPGSISFRDFSRIFPGGAFSKNESKVKKIKI
jgi:hypothetical protein